jgi:hypothetical protein
MAATKERGDSCLRLKAERRGSIRGQECPRSLDFFCLAERVDGM